MDTLKKELPFLLLLTLLLSLPTLVAGLRRPDFESRETRIPISAHFPEARAAAIARKANPAAEMVGCKLEQEEGKLVYETVLVAGHRQHVVLVDAHDGSILLSRIGAEM